MSQDTIIVGAGVAGLRCAGILQKAGRSVLVLERARSVGGRCATRRFEGQPVDFGPMFLHGHQPAFLEALEQLGEAELIQGWPRKVAGDGAPCQPGALLPSVRRFALASGLKALPRHLAEGLEIHLETSVVGLAVETGGFRVTSADGSVRHCRDLVLALALEQSRRLLGTLPACAERAGLQALLGLFGSLPCLTLILGYPADTRAPAWDLCYPEAEGGLHLVAHDSSKRPVPRFRTLVAQARPGWSRQNLDTPPEVWSRQLLEETAALAGPWARQPLWRHPHRWRYARVDATSELSQPVQVRFPEGQSLGLAGDLFAPGGGVQAAYTSGTRMAERLLAKEQG